MLTTARRPGITFSVDEVTPATELLPEWRISEAVKHTLGGNIESCSDYHGTVLKNINYQPLLAAVYTAFSQHRPLVLTPDFIWLTIAQGVAHHMAIHGERLRSRLVSHQGKLDLVFECHDWIAGSPENPWPDAFDSWAGQIRDHVGPAVHDSLVCDFSTTGPIERAASQVVMMDIFERYFHYLAYCICGIPTVTLEGTTADWHHLTDKAVALSVYELDWWLPHLLPVCEQFVRASRGDVDVTHWRNICKLQDDYGGDVINGWVAKLFPYLRKFINGPCTRRNPIFETGEGFQSFDAPSGLSRVPFTWRDVATGRSRRMEAVGGVVGVSQDTENLALRPKVGWAVREAERIDIVLARLVEEHTTFPGSSRKSPRGLPEDLCKFYHHTNGAELFGDGTSVSYRIEGVQNLERLDWGQIAEHFRDNDYPNGEAWFRLVKLADESSLAINPKPQYPDAIRKRFLDDPGRREWDNFVAICHCRRETLGKPDQNPVVATSFTELLERLLDGGPEPYWLNPEFVGHGDAELYTRRD
jgi:hypothetical protein